MPPQAHRVLTHPDLAGDRSVRVPVGGCQDDPGSQHITVRAAGSIRPAGQNTSFFVGEDDEVSAGGRHIHF